MSGLIIDLFAGGGGASVGIRAALGRDPDFAVNHDPLAVAMHRVNHPGTVHYTQDVWQVQPSWVVRGMPVDLLWASPDCTHFSKARGGKPNRDQKRRDLAWVVVKWAEQARPRVILLENVEEFRTWGPLDANGVPVKAAAGETFRAWVRSLRRLGYKVEWRELRACDYGAPTIRKRLFLVARCDGLPIVWPEPTHGPGRPLPWRTAAECIDWSIPCPSIFGRKRPLAENTMRRIAEGIRRYVLGAAEPFIVGCGGRMGQSPPRSSGEPLQTITGKADSCVCAPCLVKANHGYEHFRGNYLREPLRTITASEPGFALAAPVLVTNTSGHAATPMGGQVPTLSTGQQQALVSPLLVGAGGPSYGGKPVETDKPMGTLMAENHTALVSAFLAKHYGGVVGTRPDQPAGTVTTIDHHGLVAAHFQRDFGQSVGHAAGDPCGTITAGGGGKEGVVTSHLLKLRGTSRHGQDMREPGPTLTAGGMHAAEVRAFLVKYYGEGGQWQGPGEPVHTIPTKDRLGLVTVTIQGQPYVLADIGLRMLQPRELFRAQGFPDSYVIDMEVDGRRLSKSDQVRLCGNSVCPPMAAALARANCGWMLEQAGEDAAQVVAGMKMEGRL